jgi:hypothetical protein
LAGITTFHVLFARTAKTWIFASALQPAGEGQQNCGRQQRDHKSCQLGRNARHDEATTGFEPAPRAFGDILRIELGKILNAPPDRRRIFRGIQSTPIAAVGF